MQKAVFFDRDGTINVDVGYLHNTKDLVFIENVPELIQSYNKRDYLVIVITNQSGISRGIFSVEEMVQLHQVMNMRLRIEFAAHIDAFYFCPHLPKMNCNCRKPKPGLFLKAISDYNIDPAISISYGNSSRDREASKNAGVGEFYYIIY